MTKTFAIAAAIALLCLGNLVHADVFKLGTGFTNLDTVVVGDPGNIGELSGAGAGGYGLDRACGSVGYNYRISKYEVTTKQYTDFLNAKAKTDDYGLYNSFMWSNAKGCKIQRTGNSGNYSYTVENDYANRPVNYVSYWDSVRFANWLNNGQGNGNTETGAYTLNGYNGDLGHTIQRNVGWKWAVTSENEWYKAAYYKGGGTNAGYWDYPTISNTIPGRDMGDASGNNANYWANGYLINTPYYRTDVGEFQNSDSPYGTFDQGGNVWEWNEAIVYRSSIYAYRSLRGSAFDSFDNGLNASYSYYCYNPTYEYYMIGFRVVSVPEPSSIVALLGGLVGLLGMRRRGGSP